MSQALETIKFGNDFTVRNYLPPDTKQEKITEILTGLLAPRQQQRRISCVYFYDALGSKLFEEITALPEYYLTRTEKPLIAQAARGLVGEMHSGEIIELGSGDCSKISLLFRAWPSHQFAGLSYRPIDISRSAVEDSARQLFERFPGITFDGIITDFVSEIGQLARSRRKRLFCFFGSTAGNLDLAQRDRFFVDLGHVMQRGDRLLLGVDLIKDRGVLERAYNDTKGVTKQFNRNILNVVNRIAGTDFSPQMFEHLAYYNEVEGRIEMHLRARKDQWITSPYLEQAIYIGEGETIHTENSYKFTRQQVAALAGSVGLETETCFTDSNRWFALFQFVKR